MGAVVMPGKRCHKTLTLIQKRDVIESLKQGISGKHLALKYGVGTSTISDIKKNQSNILKFVNNCYAEPKKRKTLRKAEYPKMEKKLYSWFLTQRSRHVPVSDALLASKAQQLHQICYNNNGFVASRGWITNFKSRHGIRLVKICGEKLSNNESAVKPFISDFTRKIKALDLSKSQIYNADESALYWKILPDKTLVYSEEKSAPGRKTIKERVTFLTCANSDGTHRMKLLIIGKARNPRAFKNQQLPVEYESTRNAWMTSYVFKQWFHNSFVKQARVFLKSQNLPEKGLLLIDNCRAHASEDELISEDGQFSVMFLPPNTTALIQPMDQSAIELTKVHYKKSLLAHILANEDKSILEVLKTFTLKDAVCLLHNSWEQLKATTLEKCWRKLFPLQTDEFDSDDDNIPLSQLRNERSRGPSDIAAVGEMLNELSNATFSQSELNAWVHGDNDLAKELDLTDDNEINEEAESIDEVEAEKTVPDQNAMRAIDTCIEWAEQNNLPFIDVSALKRVKENIFFKFRNSRKLQPKLTQYFPRV